MARRGGARGAGGLSVPRDVAIGDLPSIPPLGIGTWAWGDSWFWGFGGKYVEDDVIEAYHAAVAGGVRFFDTAEVYGASLRRGLGRSEGILGELHGSSEPASDGARDRVSARPPDQRTDDDPRVQLGSKFFPFPWRVTGGRLTRALRGSLQRLRVDRLDLYQLHWPVRPRSVETWANAMADAHGDGLVREIGISNCSLNQMRRVQRTLADRGLHLASNQVEYSLLKRDAESEGLMQACRDDGVVLIAYSPLAQGLLTGKYDEDNPLPGLRGRRYNEKLAGLRPFMEALRHIARELDATPAQLALAWAMAKGTLVIPGAKNAHQAEQNAAALQVPIEDAHVVELDRLAADAPAL